MVIKNALILALILLFGNAHINGQQPRVHNLPTDDDRPIRFGFNIGLNTMDFGVRSAIPRDTIELHADLYRIQPGFHVSIVSNLRLSRNLDLRCLPGISFGQRVLYFIDIPTSSPAEHAEQKIGSSFIEFPLLLKYKGERINNFRPYLVGGGNVRLDMAAKKDYDEEKNSYIRLKPFDFYYELGVGFDNYLQYFKFSVELKYSIGIRDILVHDKDVSRPEYVNAINKLYSRLVMLSFYFE